MGGHPGADSLRGHHQCVQLHGRDQRHHRCVLAGCSDTSGCAQPPLRVRRPCADIRCGTVSAGILFLQFPETGQVLCR